MNPFPTNITRFTAAMLGLWLAIVAAAPFAAARTVIILDPGHGGADPGTTAGKVHEKHLNLDLAQRVAKHLREADRPVRLTRESDQFMTLRERVDFTNRYRNAVIVSLHFNASDDARVRGIETFHSGTSRSVTLARAVQRGAVRATSARDRGVRRQEFALLQRTRHPAILFEGGYLSHPDECKLCRDVSYRERMARGIAQSILRAVPQ